MKKLAIFPLVLLAACDQVGGVKNIKKTDLVRCEEQLEGRFTRYCFKNARTPATGKFKYTEGNTTWTVTYKDGIVQGTFAEHADGFFKMETPEGVSPWTIFSYSPNAQSTLFCMYGTGTAQDLEQVECRGERFQRAVNKNTRCPATAREALAIPGCEIKRN
jgi:hypothetical protein